MLIRSIHASLLAAAMFVMSGCAASPESTVERFYRAVANGEITEAQGYLSSQTVNMLGPQKTSAALTQEAERVQGCGGIRSIDVQLEGQGEIRSGTAVVNYRGDCEAKRETVKLTKEDGEWKLGVSK